MIRTKKIGAGGHDAFFFSFSLGKPLQNTDLGSQGVPKVLEGIVHCRLGTSVYCGNVGDFKKGGWEQTIRVIAYFSVAVNHTRK